MSFQYVPGLIRIPRIPNLTPPSGIWRGKDSDSGYFAFQGDWNWGSYLMVRDNKLAPSLLVDGSEYKPVFTDINGYIYWRGSGFIYYSLDWGWIHCSMYPGYEPVETSEYDSDKGETVYSGDTFYQINSITSSETQSNLYFISF